MTWRGTYAEHDAFDSCEQLKPTHGQEEWADFMRSCAESNLGEA